MGFTPFTADGTGWGDPRSLGGQVTPGSQAGGSRRAVLRGTGPPTHVPPPPGRGSPPYPESPEELWTHRDPGDMASQGLTPTPSSLIHEMGTIQAPTGPGEQRPGCAAGAEHGHLPMSMPPGHLSSWMKQGVLHLRLLEHGVLTWVFMGIGRPRILGQCRSRVGGSGGCWGPGTLHGYRSSHCAGRANGEARAQQRRQGSRAWRRHQALS